MTEAKVTEKKEAVKTEAPKKEVKKEVKPRAPKSRKAEILVNEATKNMTDKEKAILIKHLKEQITLKENQLNAYRENIEITRKQKQEAERMIEQCEAFYREKLQFVNVQMTAFVEAVKASIVGGTK